MIQTSVMAPVDCYQPDVEDKFNISENNNEIVRKTKGNIDNESHELRVQHFAWFYLFPYGINGLKGKKPVNILLLDNF